MGVVDFGDYDSGDGAVDYDEDGDGHVVAGGDATVGVVGYADGDAGVEMLLVVDGGVVVVGPFVGVGRVGGSLNRHVAIVVCVERHLFDD